MNAPRQPHTAKDSPQAASAGNALRAFDTADALRPTDATDPALPFLFLGGSHLDRWRGNALSQLGDPGAIDQLHHALTRHPSTFVRARTSTLVDLAFAYAAASDREGTQQHARQARQLALRIQSDRQLRRLGKLILPGNTNSQRR